MDTELNRILLKLCAYYNQDVQLKDSTNLHPRVEEAERYFKKIPEKFYDDFYNRIISNCPINMYQPSFPSRIQLSECYNALGITQNYINVDKKESFTLEQITKNSTEARKYFDMGVAMSDEEYEIWIKAQRKKVIQRELQKEKDKFGNTSVSLEIEKGRHRIHSIDFNT
jgi:hypothetical protein